MEFLLSAFMRAFGIAAAMIWRLLSTGGIRMLRTMNVPAGAQQMGRHVP
jgi:hypothetical protein